MKDYSKMSDFEVNKAVAINVGGYQGHVEHMKHGVKESDRDSHGMFYFERDYCNNPSDAWPIIVENSISIVSYGVEFSAEYGWSAFYGGVCVNYDHEIESNFEIECSDKNPLRAAMIVYLMMKDKEK